MRYAIIALALVASNACIYYEGGNTGGDCERCEPGDDGSGGGGGGGGGGGDTAGGGDTQDTQDPGPSFVLMLDPNEIAQGDASIADIKAEGTFDLSSVQSG